MYKDKKHGLQSLFLSVLIVEGTMYKLTHLSGVLSTPNPGVVDEKCALSLHYFDLLGETSNDD